MGYTDIRARKQHDKDAARICELERQLRCEREHRRVAAEAATTNARAEAEGGERAIQNAVIETLGVIGIIAIFAILIWLTAAYFGE